MNFNSPFPILSALWRHFSKPTARVLDSATQRQTRLLASFLITLLVIGILAAFTIPYAYPGTSLLEITEFYVIIATCILFVVSYLLNRIGHHALAARFTILTLTAAIFLVASPETGIGDMGILYYLALPVLLASLFLPMRENIIIAACILAALSVAPLVIPDTRPNLPLAFMFVISVIVLIVRQQRDYLESARQINLSEQERQLRVLTENTSDIITQANINGFISYSSPSLQTLLGYSPDKHLGEDVMHVMTGCHPEDVDRVKRAFAQQIAERIATRIEYRFRHADGHYVWLETIGKPLNIPGGGFVYVTRDITERKRVEEALRQSEEFFRAAVQGSMDAFYVLAFERDSNNQVIDFMFVYVNTHAEELLAMPADQLIGQRVSKAFPPEHIKPFFDRYLQAAEHGQAREDEFAVPENSPFFGWYYHQVIPLTDGLAVITRSIDERKRAEKQRLQLAVERERFNVLRRFVEEAASHDLRTHLTIMKTSLYLLGKVEELDKRQRYMDSLDTQMVQLETKIENLLTLEQLYKSDIIFERKSLELNKLIREVLMQQQIFAYNKGHTMEFKAYDAALFIDGDESALEQVIENLVKNAINFTPPGGHITIETFVERQRAMIRVVDNGIGISDADLPSIFEPFFRGDKARQIHIGEMGLGLAIVKRIVESHNGQIRADSTLGEGSIFTVRLPLPQNETPKAQP